MSILTEVNGEWACQRERAKYGPYRIDIPQPITKNLSQVIMLVTPTAVPNLVQIRPWRRLCKEVKYNKNFIFMYLFIYRFFWKHLYSLDPLMDFRTQMMQNHARVCLLRVYRVVL